MRLVGVLNTRYPYFLDGESPLESSVVSISLELSDSLSDSEPDELDASLSSFVFDAPFRVCFCLLSGSGEVDRLELLSLEEEDGGAIVAVGFVPQWIRRSNSVSLGAARSSGQIKSANSISMRLADPSGM